MLADAAFEVGTFIAVIFVLPLALAILWGLVIGLLDSWRRP